MGVDYDATLIVGWEITIPATEDDAGEYMEGIAKKVGMGFQTTGNNYSGEHRHFLVLDESVLELKEIANLHQLVADAERDMKKAKIGFAPFKIQADLHIW